MTETTSPKAEIAPYVGGALALIGVALTLLPTYSNLALLPMTIGSLIAVQSDSRKATTTVLLIVLAGCAILIVRGVAPLFL